MSNELSEKLRGFERVWERVSGKDDKADEVSDTGDCTETELGKVSPVSKSKAVRFIAGNR